MFYVYLLENEIGEFYTGFTSDLRKRLVKHNQGNNFSTKNHKWHCIYYEACAEEEDARRREKYLKTTAGRRAIRLRLKAYFTKRR
jgi:putative endonuclease